MRPCSRYITLSAPASSQFDKVALPAIIDYKVTEARCEKLPKLLPQLFSEVPEVERRYANPNPNPNPNPNQVPEAEQLRRYAVLHQKYKQPLFDIFMQLGGAPYASCPRARLCFFPLVTDPPPRRARCPGDAALLSGGPATSGTGGPRARARRLRRRLGPRAWPAVGRVPSAAG